MIADFAKHIGFYPKLGRGLFYDIGRNRFIEIHSADGPNEMLFLLQLKGLKVVDIITLHNRDYDGPLSPERLVSIVSALDFNGVTANKKEQE